MEDKRLQIINRMKYFFILGRNPELSRAEIFSYLEAEGIIFREIFFEQNFLAFEFEKEIKLNIQEFGGALKLGKIIFQGDEQNFCKYLEQNEIVEKDKFSYSIFGNIPDNIFSEKFKKEKKKALIKRSGHIELQSGDYLQMPKSDISFFAFCFNNVFYLGITEQEYSYNDVKNRDMNKPVRRESLAISPRLAKILINLSQVKNGILLDPFCGIGGILIEGLIKGINVIGIDKDKNAIEGAKRNLGWLEKNYKLHADYKLINSDSKNILDIKVEGIATEPELGEIARGKPNDKDAKLIISKFEQMIVPVLKRMKEIKKQNARIVFTAPLIRGFTIDIAKILKETGLKKIASLPEFRQGQFIAREIIILK